jgi:stage IV sporulation protein A
MAKKLKLMTIFGTRPEIIRLSEVIKKCDKYFDRILVHTGQNWDYTLNQIFFEDLGLREPDYYLEAVGEDLGETIGNIIAKSYKVLSEVSRFEITSDGDIFKLMKEYAKTKVEYDKIAVALDEVRIKGYGIVTPQIDELKLEEPEIVKQGNKFGVKLKASAPSIHMIRCDVETEISPIVGSEKQSEDLVKYLLSEFENDTTKLWESNIFGKSLHELVNEGLQNKLYRMPEEAQMKLQETLQRIINEGSGGLICIIL